MGGRIFAEPEPRAGPEATSRTMLSREGFW